MLYRTGLRASRQAFQPFQASRTFTQFAARRAAHPAESERGLTGVYDNAFNRERLAVKQHAAATSDFWRRLSIYVVIPCLILASANTWVQWNEHWEHQSHLPDVSERKQYAYMNLRAKAYPWGDGNKTAFWNPAVNYVPESD